MPYCHFISFNCDLFSSYPCKAPQSNLLYIRPYMNFIISIILFFASSLLLYSTQEKPIFTQPVVLRLGDYNRHIIIIFNFFLKYTSTMNFPLYSYIPTFWHIDMSSILC